MINLASYAVMVGVFGPSQDYQIWNDNYTATLEDYGLTQDDIYDLSTYDEIKQGYSKFIRQIVIQGIEKGDINSDLDLDLVVFVVDTVINAFNNYLPHKLGNTADVLAEKGSSSFDSELAKETFDRLITIMKFGLANQRNTEN